MAENYRALFEQGFRQKGANTDEALTQMRQAREMAHQAGDKESVLYMNHWILQTLVFDKLDFNEALELAVKTASEARKPMYAQMREKICVNQDLILAYLGIDPVGYAELIQEAIDHMASQIQGPIGCAYCLQELRCSFEIANRRDERALEESNKYVAMSEGGWYADHHGGLAYGKLCELAFHKQEWEELIRCAKIGEELVRRNTHIPQTHGYFMACLAFGYRKLGATEKAHEQYRLATKKAGSLKASMHPPYYDMLCAYHELEGDLQAALNLRTRQVEQMAGKGQRFWESRARIERCRYLKALGQPYETEASETRQLIEGLKRPQGLLVALEQALA